MSIFSAGIILEQHKEPMLSRDMRLLDKGASIRLFENPYDGVDPHELRPKEIREIARLAGIIDETDGAPLCDKLESARERGVATVYCDAIDDEPYISSQLGIVLRRPEESALALELAMKACEATDMRIAVYKHVLDIAEHMPRKIAGVPVQRVGGRYPAELRAYRSFRRRQSMVTIGAGALLHLIRAAKENTMQTTCFVTVAGDAIANPYNVEAPIGTPVSALLEFCGLAADPEAIVVGGSMTGRTISEPDDEPVGVMTRAVLAFRESYKSVSYTCIGCGRCDSVCPEGLSACQLRRFAEFGRYDKFALYDADRCIGCGACSYVCPSKLDIAATIYKAKDIAAKEGGEE